jgi:hypothetical protein
MEVKVDPAALAAAEAANRLQKRVEEMMVELQSAKEEIEAYKRRAEVAEEEGASSRRSLAEMVEKIRKEEEARKLREKEIGLQTDSVKTNSLGIQVVPEEKAEVVNEKAVDGHVKGMITRGAPKNSTSVVKNDGGGKERTLLISKRDAAPYASIIGVMLFGVGLMAVLNGWQKGER